MKKKLLSIILTLLLICGTLVNNVSAAFSDINDSDTALAASVLQSMGIVDGVGGDKYNPDSILNRAQFCALVVRMVGLEDKVAVNSYKTLFTDVKPGAWYTGYVNLAYSEKLVNGYGNGKFGPDDSVTYGQVATILLRLLGFTENDIGKAWPTDYTNFAHELELDKGLALSAYSTVTRGQTAELLYNTLETEKNGSDAVYFKTISGVSSTQTVIVLNVNAINGVESGQLMACNVTDAGASVEYFSQKNSISSDLEGYIGDLLLNSAGKVVGFMPSANEFKDVTISSAKTSGITDASGETYRITGKARVIAGSDIYTWNNTGYINAQTGKTARLYYDNDGAVQYVYLSTGTSGISTEVVVAETNTVGSELARKLGVTGGYKITKNGSTAQQDDLAKYDVAYYDKATRTLCASDYRVTGCIEAASPSVDSAETITVAGHEFSVLEAAWDTLKDFSLGSYITIMLTDDCKVAAATVDSKISNEMIGVLAMDGSSVTLCGSGIVLTADDIYADDVLRGMLVRVRQTFRNELSCYAYATPNDTGKLDISANMLGSYKIAPSCAIYEQAGKGSPVSYVYSLSGELGVSSSDFTEINWTTSLPFSYVNYYHLNSTGQVDILLLHDVTGNCYDYGKFTFYPNQSGINLSSLPTLSVWYNAATITNGNNNGESNKYLYTRALETGTYVGIALRAYNTTYQDVASVTSLIPSGKIGSEAFFQSNGDWYATVSDYEIPVNDNVQIYISNMGKWISGEEGLLTALSSGMPMKVYYDRTLSTGAQVRVIVVQTT